VPGEGELTALRAERDGIWLARCSKRHIDEMDDAELSREYLRAVDATLERCRGELEQRRKSAGRRGLWFLGPLGGLI
jgi:hypothetical protein